MPLGLKKDEFFIELEVWGML